MSEPERLFETVLLLEDDSSHALLVKRAVKDFVGSVVHVDTLKGALEKLSNGSPPALIITDLHVPDGNGVALVTQLRDVCPDTPLIVLTSSTSLTDAVEAMKLGARDFIVKNFNDQFRDVFAFSLSRVFVAVEYETERKRLQREMEVLRVAIENSDEGLAVGDAHGDIVYSNTAYQNYVRLWGGAPESISFLLSSAVNKAESLSATLVEKISELPNQGVWNTEITLKNEKETAFGLSLSVIDSSPNGGRAFVLWIKDLTAEKGRQKFQREILATTTHDLKGPLGAILLSSELLATMAGDRNRVAELALRIGSSAQGAVNLIDEFLSARRIQEGTFILKPISHDLGETVQEIFGSYETMSQAKSIRLTYEIAKEHIVATFDKLAIQRVVGNLLSNAIKFTPKGGEVHVALSCDDDEFHIKVSDTGCGMEPSEVTKIFERFSRLSKHSEVAGSGLGLFVVKSIVAAHGGIIEVTSQVGQGTTFTVSIPLSPPVNDKGELISLAFA